MQLFEDQIKIGQVMQCREQYHLHSSGTFLGPDPRTFSEIPFLMELLQETHSSGCFTKYCQYANQASRESVET